MRKLASLFLLALFVGCSTSSGVPEEEARRPERGGDAGDTGSAGTKAKGGAAGSKAGAKGGDDGTAGSDDEPTAGAGGDGAGGGVVGKGGAAGAQAGGAAGKSGGGPAPNPCAGVACNTPPDKKCKNDTELEVFTGPGSCDEGECSYASNTITCEKGCKDDACAGNACLGISCNAPPAPSCIGPQDLLAYDAGSCSEGKCTYPDKKIFCQFGCENGACKGNPCSGKICGQPPASFCSAADKLSVFESIGSCDNITGGCTYAKEEKTCEHGCENGACKGDPCVGVSCLTPPAAFCSDASTKKVSVSPGTCKGGSCTYTTADQKCPFGCGNGVCKDCAADADCGGGGKYCDNGVCRLCDGDLRCGTSCTNCVTSAKICSAGACVQCLNDAQCGAGKFCEGNTCKTCDTVAKCGPTCGICLGSTPTCAGNVGCVCTDSSCGPNNKCAGGACAFCNTADACGATCTPCAGATPACKTTGTTSACVECTTNEQCGAGKTCTADNKCVAGCPPPADSCANGSQNRDRCTGARIIGRKVATAGYAIAGNTCTGSDRSDESGCSDSGYDHHYRVYMRKGESAKIGVQTGESCLSYDFAYWQTSLKIYQPAACSQGVLPPYDSCGARTFCNGNFNNSETTYVAPEDGWVVIVVDGAGGFDDEGDYTLSVKLTCSTGNCECP